MTQHVPGDILFGQQLITNYLVIPKSPKHKEPTAKKKPKC